jgi:hypothetical protein
VVCTPPRCSPATLSISLFLLTFFFPWPCLDYGGNPSRAHPSTKTGCAWSFNHILPPHLHTSLRPLRPPSLVNPLKAKLASHLFPHLGIPDLSCSTSWELTGIFLRAIVGPGLFLATCLSHPTKFSREFSSCTTTSSLTTNLVSTGGHLHPLR